MTGIPISTLILCGGLFLFSVMSGVWVSRLGRPLNSGVFTIHKLVALATIAVIGIQFYQLSRTTGLATLLDWIAVIAALLMFLALFATGALLSFDRPVPVVPLRVHQAAPLLALVASAAVFYLLNAAANAAR